MGIGKAVPQVSKHTVQGSLNPYVFKTGHQ